METTRTGLGRTLQLHRFWQVVEKGVTLERALEIAMGSPFPRKTESVLLEDAAGRLLARDLASKVDDPRFDNSAMDGWAVRKADCKDTGSVLRIVGTSQAGSSTTPSVGKGEACSIMTGAPLPEGADSIVMIEDSITEGERVTINGPARTEYIRKKGENLVSGTIALVAGSLLTPAATSLAATMGHSELEVVSKPKIAVIGVGDELTPPGEPLADGAIYESNTYGIASLVRKMGGSPVRFEIIQDTTELLRETLDEAAESCDAIITSGGVSMGEWDIVRILMEAEGDIGFWKIMMRPGGPPLFGSWKGAPVFGLPGNPVSSHVVFTVLVSQWISKCMGADLVLGPRMANRVRVIMEEPLKGAPGKLCLRRISIRQEGDHLVGSTTTHQGSGNIHSMVAHNALSLLPPDTDSRIGETIDALWLI
jgi:molybdopterin molybdotransferase